MLLGTGTVILSAILYGMIPLLTKLLYSFGFDAIAVAFFRYACVLPIIVLYCCFKKKRLKISFRSIFSLFGYVGFFSGATMILLNMSYQYIPVGMATTLHFLYPSFVILICVVYYKQKIERSILYSMALVLIGILFFFERGNIHGVIGIVLAILSGFTYAVYLVQLERHKFNQMDPVVFTFYLSLCTILTLIVINLHTHSIQDSLLYFQDTPLWIIPVLTLFSMFANICIAYGSRYLGATMTALFSLFEPITSLFSGFFFLHENLTLLKIIGSIIILIAILNVALSQNKKDKKIVG